MADLFRIFLIFSDFESHARPQEAKTGKKVIATRGRLTTRGQAWPSLATRGRVCFLRPHVDELDHAWYFLLRVGSPFPSATRRSSLRFCSHAWHMVWPQKLPASPLLATRGTQLTLSHAWYITYEFDTT